MFNHPENWGFIYSALLYNFNDYEHDSGQVVGHREREKKTLLLGAPLLWKGRFPFLGIFHAVNLPCSCCHFQKSPSSELESFRTLSVLFRVAGYLEAYPGNTKGKTIARLMIL